MLEFRGVSFRYVDSKPVLDDIDLKVERQELVALLGTSGSGKSTAIRLAAGLHRPRTGHVLLRGRDASELPPRDRRVGYVPQSLALFPNLNVLDNVTFRLRSDRVPKTERRRHGLELLERVGIASLWNARVHEISGGQAQRVALARALAGEVEVLLLDEPYSNLDPLSVEAARELAIDIHRQLGTATVLVTHSAHEALASADRIAVIGAGRVMQVGKPREVYDLPADPAVAELTGPTNWIPGVIEATGTPLQVSTAFGSFCCRWLSFQHPQLGDRCRILARPEWLDLTSVEEAAARVKRTEWFGSSASALIQGEDATVRVVISRDELTLQEGTNVAIVARRNHTLPCYAGHPGEPK